MGILRDFGKGVAYIFAVPGYIILLAVSMVIGLIIFVFNSFVYVVKFVTGRNMGILTKEDKQGKEIMKEKQRQYQGIQQPVTRAEIIEPTPVQQAQPQYQAPVSQQIEHAQPTPVAHQIEYEEEPVITRIEQQPVHEETPQIEAPKEPEPEPEPDPEPEEYNPKTSNF